MIRHMLSTKDNPFDPFDEFDQWLQFDVSRGYHSCNVLADRAITSNGELSNKEDDQSISDAIDEIILEFPMIDYIKCTKEY